MIVSDHPTFKWEQVSGATSYTVYITDKNGKIVSQSSGLPGDHKEWRIPNLLKRGEIYKWTLSSVIDGHEITSPGPAAPEMKFQVLSGKQLLQLNQMKKTPSHLAVGIFYTNVGMLGEAEREFQELLRLNPNGRVASNLLTKVRWLRGR